MKTDVNGCSTWSQTPFGFAVISDYKKGFKKIWKQGESQTPFGFAVISDTEKEKARKAREERKSQTPFGFAVISDEKLSE